VLEVLEPGVLELVFLDEPDDHAFQHTWGVRAVRRKIQIEVEFLLVCLRKELVVIVVDPKV
jgi:hypothetical protein